MVKYSNSDRSVSVLAASAVKGAEERVPASGAKGGERMFKMKKVTTIIFLAVLVVMLFLTGVIVANPSTITVEPWVMAGGGGRVTPAANIIEVTIGQSAVGQINNEQYGLCAGYWCYEDYNAYLPLIRR